MRVTVLGATGGIGRAIVTELTDRGHEVTAASRSAATSTWPIGVRALTTDLLDPSQAAAACRGADVVVMAAQIPYAGWATQLGPMVDAAVDAAADAGARLVMVDNLYAYGSPGTPLTEASPEAATSRKGRLRADLGRRLLEEHRSGRVRVTIGRFSDYYGPHGTNSLVYGIGVTRALAGKAPRVYIDGDQPHTFAYLPDAARGFATLVEHPEADGRVWVLPAMPPITQRELMGMVAREAGLGPKLGTITPMLLRLAGLFDANLREAIEVSDQFDRPWITDASAFEAAFGPIQLTPHEQAIAATVAWFRDHEAVPA
jgi:nucleoside-diphosphate-sugar epimerase